jgi:hypothetical protein
VLVGCWWFVELRALLDMCSTSSPIQFSLHCELWNALSLLAYTINDKPLSHTSMYEVSE